MKINIKTIIFFVLTAILFQASSVFAAIKTDPNFQLISAAKKGDLGGVKNAISKGANVNAKSYGPHGNTALHIAVWDGNVNLVKLLRGHGADPRITNKQGKSAIDLARDRGRYDMAKKFEEDYVILSVVPPSSKAQVSQPLTYKLPDLSINNSPVWKSPFTIINNVRQLQIVEGKAVVIQNGKLYWGNVYLCDLTKAPVRFYHPKQDYYGQWFGNFSQHKAIYGGDTFNTSEHAFQAQKIALSVGGKNQDYYKILNSTDSDEAKKIARQYFIQGWDYAKIDIMLNILKEKFKQNSDCAKILKSTTDHPLLENTVSSNDKEWGIGADGTGKNLLGILLMIVRSEI